MVTDPSIHPSIPPFSSVCVAAVCPIIHLQKLLVLFIFGIDHKCGALVFSDFPSFLCFCLFFPPALQKTVRKVRDVPPHVSLLPAVFLSSSVLFCCACFNSATPSSSPLLSGLFQTPGAGQEPPGLALLCPLLLPIHTGTQSSVSSQQQLQEDKIAAGHPAASQTVTHFCMKSRAVCWLLYCSVSQERCWIFLLFPREPSLWTCDLQAWPISESPELKPVQMVNTVASPARFHFFFSLCGFCLHAFCFCSPFSFRLQRFLILFPACVRPWTTGPVSLS